VSPVYGHTHGDDPIGRILGNPVFTNHIRQLAKEEARQVRFGPGAREVFEPRSIPQRAVETRIVDHLPRQAEEQEEILLAPGDGSLVIPLIFHKGRWRVMDPLLTLPRRAIMWIGMGHNVHGPAGFIPGTGSANILPNGWAIGLSPAIAGFRREYRAVGQYHYAPSSLTTASHMDIVLWPASLGKTWIIGPGPPFNVVRDVHFATSWEVISGYDTSLHDNPYAIAAAAQWATQVGTYYIRHFEIQVRYVLEGV
jgi:hypothetical protein